MVKFEWHQHEVITFLKGISGNHIDARVFTFPNRCFMIHVSCQRRSFGIDCENLTA